MELDDLTQAWQNLHQASQNPEKDAAQIRNMIRNRSLETFFKIRTKVFIEIMAFLLLIFVLMTALDAQLNKIYVNGLVIAVVLFGIGDNFILSRNITFNANGENLLLALGNMVAQFRWQLRFSVYFSWVFFGGIALFFGTRLVYNPFKMILLLLIFLISSSIRVWVERRSWRSKIHELEICLAELTQTSTQ